MPRKRASDPPQITPPFQRIYLVVARIPRGRVATYGQVARLAGRVTARLVGFAMAGAPTHTAEGKLIPWQRVINSRAEVSPRKQGEGHVTQRRLLEREGVRFDPRGRVDLARHAWHPTR